MTSARKPAIGLLALCILGCAVHEKKQATVDNEAVVDAYVRAWNAHDSLAFDTLLTADAVHEDLAQNFRGKNPKEIRGFMTDLISVEPDFKWTITNRIEEGNFVAIEWTWAATYTGPDPAGKNVTRRRISGRGGSYAEVDNGKIRRFSDYYDQASFFR